jgi:myosin-1
MDPSQWQLGQSKIFIRSPESLFMLEEMRERVYDDYARKIQRAYRRWKAQKYFLDLRRAASALMYGKKERKRFTINRDFIGDYINIGSKPYLRNLIGAISNPIIVHYDVGNDQKVLFCDTIRKYDRRFNVQERGFFITETGVFLLGPDKIKQGPNKGKMQTVVKRFISYQEIAAISLRCVDGSESCL